MEEIKKLKIAAYLLDRAIMLHPYEAQETIYESPEFTEHKSLNEISLWGEQDLQYISSLFWESEADRNIIKGFFGTGVGLDKLKRSCLILFGNKTFYDVLDKKSSYLHRKCPFPIYFYGIEKAEFASQKFTQSIKNLRCPGGSCILTPSRTGNGILGAWLRKIPNGLPIGITSNHIAAGCNRYSPGTKICLCDGSDIGVLDNYIILRPYKGKNDNNYSDFAWIKPNNNNIIDYSLSCSGAKPKGEVDLEYEFFINNKKAIKICGKESKFIEGIILFFMPVFYLEALPFRYRFLDVIVLNIGKLGYSGSLVLDENFRIGGMFFAVSYTTNGDILGYANKWKYVKSNSGLKFLY